jgi:hypothetical protein
MSPHWLFAVIMTLSISAAISHAVGSNNIGELVSMAVILGLALACVGIALLATRKYWKDARRLA